ncbi:MAG: type II toxin-antitoxin system HicA family toxin [Candidatus Bathyarchaeia archaeon]
MSGLKIIKALGKAGFTVVGRKGSHVRLKKKTAQSINIVIVPVHAEIKRGTLKSILRQAGLTVDDLERLLKE